MRKILSLLIMALFLIITMEVPSYSEVMLKFGLYTSDKPSTLKKKFSPIIKVIETDMSRALGEPVKIDFKFANSYEGGVHDLINGAVDFSRFGPASYIEAKKANPGISILAVEANKGSKTFNGIICVTKDSSIHTIKELKGKSFAFGDKQSTIGRYLSQQYMAKHGVKASDLGKYEYLKNHEEVGIAVARGKFDAGALKESTYKKLVKKGADLRILASFPNVTKPWLARSGLAENIKKTLRDVLVQMKNPDALKVLKKDGFLPGTNEDYDVIRSAIDNNKMFFY